MAMCSCSSPPPKRRGRSGTQGNAACCVLRVARGMLSVVSHGPAVRRGHRHVELAVHEKGLDEAQHLPVLHECSQCSAHRPVLLFGRDGPGRAGLQRPAPKQPARCGTPAHVCAATNVTQVRAHSCELKGNSPDSGSRTTGPVPQPHLETCIALHCVALHCVALHCIALHCIALPCITLHYITLHYITLHCIALHCIALHYMT